MKSLSSPSFKTTNDKNIYSPVASGSSVTSTKNFYLSTSSSASSFGDLKKLAFFDSPKSPYLNNNLEKVDAFPLFDKKLIELQHNQSEKEAFQQFQKSTTTTTTTERNIPINISNNNNSSLNCLPKMSFKTSSHYVVSNYAVSSIVNTINSMMTVNADKLAASYCATNFRWRGVYLYRSFHCDFEISLFQSPTCASACAIEVLAIEGDREIAVQIYALLQHILSSTNNNVNSNLSFQLEELKLVELFDDEMCVDAFDGEENDDDFDDMDDLLYGSSPVPSSPAAVAAVAVAPQAACNNNNQVTMGNMEAMSTATNPEFELLTQKKQIVEWCHAKNRQFHTEAAQLACDVYANTIFIDNENSNNNSSNSINNGKNVTSRLTVLDEEIIVCMVNIVKNSYSVREWSCQHATWILAHLTKHSKTVCDIILKREPKFPSVIFRFANEEHYMTNLFRRKCADMIHHFLHHHEHSVDSFVGPQLVEEWLHNNNSNASKHMVMSM